MSRAPGGRWIIRPWLPYVPTMYFLDINAIDLIKKSGNGAPLPARKAALLARLRDIDRAGNRVSCLLALMEKVNDRKSALSDGRLRGEIQSDVAFTRRFFIHAKPGDPENFHLEYFDGVRGGMVEQNEPNYLKFLRTVNDRHRLAFTVSAKKRFEKAKDLIASADELQIDRRHPVVVLALACLYDNLDARKVMKFTEKPADYRAENVLADVMTIGRFLERKIELEEMGRRGESSMRRVEYITDDAGLAAVLKCYRGTSVSYTDLGGSQEIRTTGSMEFADLLTRISHDLGPLSDPADPVSAAPSEYARVCELLYPGPSEPVAEDASTTTP